LGDFLAQRPGSGLELNKRGACRLPWGKGSDSLGSQEEGEELWDDTSHGEIVDCDNTCNAKKGHEKILRSQVFRILIRQSVAKELEKAHFLALLIFITGTLGVANNHDVAKNLLGIELVQKP
jgi:hypothetical protein